MVLSTMHKLHQLPAVPQHNPCRSSLGLAVENGKHVNFHSAPRDTAQETARRHAQALQATRCVHPCPAALHSTTVRNVREQRQSRGRALEPPHGAPRRALQAQVRPRQLLGVEEDRQAKVCARSLTYSISPAPHGTPSLMYFTLNGAGQAITKCSSDGVQHTAPHSNGKHQWLVSRCSALVAHEICTAAIQRR
jgi:hypothetical protein